MNRLMQHLRAAGPLVVVGWFALPVVGAQSAQVAYYQLPSGAYPHDVAPAADGAIWFTGQSQGFLGHFDPASGKLEKVPLGRGSAPHGVIVGPDRAAWVTDGGQNAIARVDPANHQVKLFPLPREFPDANLNTATFDQFRHPLVHRPKRRLWPRRSEERQGRCLEVAARCRHLRHDGHAVRRDLVRLACQ